MWTVSRQRARWLTLVATSLGFGVVQLDVSVVNVAIKPIGAALGGGVGSLQWVVNAYTLAFAALILAAGALGDRVGAKRVFVSGFVVFTVASAACGLAPSLGFLIGARAVQGIGAAVLVPCSLALLRHTFADPAERARAVGLWAAGASVALSAGPLVGGILTETLGWRAIFFINAPIGVAGILITVRWAVETPRARGRLTPPLSLLRSATFSCATAIGFGLGLVVPSMTSALLGSVHQSRAGVASGTLNTARQTGSVIGVEVYGALIAGGGLVGGLHAALAISVGLALVVAGLSAGIRSPAL